MEAPADEHPSLSVEEKGGKLLVRCQAKCSQEDVITALRERGLWHVSSANGGREGQTLSVGRVRVLENAPRGAGTVGNGRRSDVRAPIDPVSSGLTLEELASAKSLPLGFLKGLGLSTITYQGQPAVRIPYLDETGSDIGTRFRTALQGGARFRWKSGSKTHPYGLSMLHLAREARWVLVVEGESDCWTAWHHKLPAFGVPGKSTWRREWAECLEGLIVFIWQEPGAEDFTERIIADIPMAHIIPAPEGAKDVSDIHLRGDDLPQLLERLRSTAVPASVLLAERRNAAMADAAKRAADVLDCSDVLARFEMSAHRMGYGGNMRPAKLSYLAMTSRVLETRRGGILAHLLLLGPPSAGKNFTEKIARAHLPEIAYHVIDAGSPRVLIYDDAPLKHKVVVFGEADSLPAGEDNPAASAIRNLLQDGHLHYDVVVRDEDTGEPRVKKVRKPGPTTLVTTSTRPLGAQLMTRVFTVDIPYDQAQIRAALKAQADGEKDDAPQEPDSALVAFQEYLQCGAPWAVVVPFSGALAEHIGTAADNPRAYRDFGKLLTLIKAHAVLHHRRRQRDQAGRIVAAVADYCAVYELVADYYQSSVTGVTEAIRQVVQAVKKMREESGTEVTIRQADVTRHLKLGEMAVSRAVRAAINRGWLVNNKAYQKSNKTYDLDVGEPLPDNQAIPHPNELEAEAVSNNLTAFTESAIPPPPVQAVGVGTEEEQAEWTL